QSQAASNNPRFVVGIKEIGTDTYGEELDLEIGDKVRVKLAVVNETPNNTINDLHIFSVFGHDGVLSWIQADNLDKVGVPKLAFNTPDNARIQYIPGSTYYETNVHGDTT